MRRRAEGSFFPRKIQQFSIWFLREDEIVEFLFVAPSQLE